VVKNNSIYFDRADQQYCRSKWNWVIICKQKSPNRKSYDLVTARAVARLSVLSEFCLPLVKIGGQMVALKASNARTETAEGDYAVKQLGGQLVTDEAFKLPETGDPRHIIVIDKKRPTPKRYPRKPGTPAKQPLTAPE